MQLQAIPFVLLSGLLSLVQAGEEMNIHFPGAIRSVETRAENLMVLSPPLPSFPPLSILPLQSTSLTLGLIVLLLLNRWRAACYLTLRQQRPTIRREW